MKQFLLRAALAVLAYCAGALVPVLAQTLTVGLYPYVPNPQQFQTVLAAEWRKVQPNVQLNFLGSDAWDGGYSMDPPPNADVVVFDGMFFEYFRSRNLIERLAPGEIQNLSDFLPYALEGVKAADGQYYAIPQLGCAELLFYRKSDAALANAKTLSQVKQSLGQCSFTSQIPPDRRGLLLDLSGGTTDAALYLDTTHSITGQYPFPLPASPDQLNKLSIQNLRGMLSTSSFENATRPSDNPYIFAQWFSNGWGRAYVGYSESMSFMSEAARNDVAFKPMPFSDNPSARPLFYADVIGVNTTVNQRGTRALAVQLANVMAATSTMLQSIVVNGAPQYLFPTRASVFNALRPTYPIYGKMQELVQASNPLMFKLDSQSRAWLASPMKGVIKKEVLSDTVCGCDFPAVQIISGNATAGPICTTTCSTHGGWNGQWTNQYPASQNGSACGCNTCPLPVAQTQLKGRRKP
jgi:thiamine pyridinylase